MAHVTFPKPLRGDGLLASRQRTKDRKAHEERVMGEAKRRDGSVCRWPDCEYKTDRLPIDPCHLVHRGMGGDPKGTRTTKDSIIALCRKHHGLMDAALIEIEPQTEQGTDGPCAFYELREGGRMECIAIEVRIGVSVARTA